MLSDVLLLSHNLGLQQADMFGKLTSGRFEAQCNMFDARLSSFSGLDALKWAGPEKLFCTQDVGLWIE